MPRRNLSLLLPTDRAGLAVTGEGDPVISGMSEDYRAIAPGHLFAALPGSENGIPIDITRAVLAALRSDAVAIIAPLGTPVPQNSHVTFITSENPAETFSRMTAAFYAAQPKAMAAVMGDDADTVAQFARALWANAARRAACIGSMGLIAPHLSRTTPAGDTVSLYRDLALLAENSISHCICACSTPTQLAGTKLSVVACTGAADIRFCTSMVPEGTPVILNSATPDFETARQTLIAARRPVASYGTVGADVYATNIMPSGDGVVLDISAWGTGYTTSLPFADITKIDAALCALTLVVASGEMVGNTIAALADLPVPLLAANGNADPASSYVQEY